MRCPNCGGGITLHEPIFAGVPTIPDALTPQGDVGEIVEEHRDHAEINRVMQRDNLSQLHAKTADLITTLSARITALEAERDEALGVQFTTNAEGDSITWEEAFEMERSYRGHFEKRAAAAEAEVKRLREALSASIVAIDDWLHLYAPEHCREEDVAQSRIRISDGGTLAYIATTQERNRAALAEDGEAK